MAHNFFSPNQNVEVLQENIGYFFQDITLLQEALTHKSYANEMQLVNSFGNERLEFLGDAVLELAITELIMNRFQDFSEGRLSKMRAAIVNTHELAAISARLGLGEFILLSKGESDNMGREKKSILANVYEAVIAAVYRDGGFECAFGMIEKHFSGHIDEVSEKGYFKDYKSRLQEYAQKKFNAVPQYAILTEEGPDHVKHFVSQVSINGVVYETGEGRNKKSAEQDAAEKTINTLEDIE